MEELMNARWKKERSDIHQSDKKQRKQQEVGVFSRAHV